MIRFALPALVLFCAGAFAQSVKLERLGSYTTGVFNRGAAEIAAYDAATRRLFVVNGDIRSVDVLDISRPAAPRLAFQIRFEERWGNAANSVAVRNGVVAVAVEALRRQDPGSVVFFDADGRYLNHVPVGPVPDMVTFSPDGNYVLTANEGEPSANYAVDPEGSVSVIDISKGIAAASVRTARFERYNGAAVDPAIRIYGPRATFAQDVEPEYIAVSPDSRTAWVTLQEANAIAEIDIMNASVVRVTPLGFKDHSKPGNGFDASDRDNAINIRNWPVFGMYQPDGIATFQSGGKTYLITANEGDSREYDGFAEEARVGALRLDPTAFPNAAELQRNENLGRLTVTRATGDTDGDGDIDRLYVLGGRSFTIWNTDGTIVWDSGDQLEQITARMFPREFNSDASGGLDTRSDNKGPEPETVITAVIDGRNYAFIALERTGGVMVWDITDVNAPKFVQYEWGRIAGGNAALGTGGDHGPEGLLYIAASDSPTGEPLLVVANEISGSTTIYRIAVSAAAGPVANVTPGDLTTSNYELSLDGSTSTGDTLKYSWRSVGRPAGLIGSDQPRVRVQFASGAGEYTIELTVTDRNGATATRRVTLRYVGSR